MAIQNPYKRKFLFLVLGSAVFMFLCYSMAFKKTINEIKLYRSNKQQLTSLEEAPVRLQLLESKLEGLQIDINSGPGESEGYQVYLLRRSTALLSGMDVKVAELPLLMINQRENVSIQTQSICYRGSFLELLKFLHSIGKDRTVGSICSVDFYNTQGNRTKDDFINMRIYFQSVTQNKQK